MFIFGFHKFVFYVQSMNFGSVDSVCHACRSRAVVLAATGNINQTIPSSTHPRYISPNMSSFIQLMLVVACGRIPAMRKSISQRLLPEYEDSQYRWVSQHLKRDITPVYSTLTWAFMLCTSRVNKTTPVWLESMHSHVSAESRKEKTCRYRCRLDGMGRCQAGVETIASSLL